MESDIALRTLRKRTGLSLRALAGRAGTSHSTLVDYEAGRKIPTVDTLARVLRSGGLTIEGTFVVEIVGMDEVDRDIELQDVLGLAEQFPTRLGRRMGYPVFGRRS